MDAIQNYLTLIAPTLMDPTTPLAIADFLHAIWIAVALLVVRIVSERMTVPILQYLLRRLKPGAEDKTNKAAVHIFDDFFIAFTSGLLEVLAVYITLYSNYGCAPWSTDPCLVAWPNHEHGLLQRWYFVASFGYYLYEFIGTFLGCGTILKTEMMVHHIATMMLIFGAYATNLLRFGTMWMALFDLSNPLLHSAKMLNAADIPALENVKWAVFATFALVFFLGRVALSPYSVLRPAFTQSFDILPLAYASIFTALMVFIYVLQCFWFYKIVLLATGGGGDKKSKTKGKAE